MVLANQTTSFLREEFISGWEPTLDRIIQETEAAEFDLVHLSDIHQDDQRKSSGSYYTPADVADHVWDLFFRFHGINSKIQLLEFLESTKIVEPASGSGIFLFTFIRRALAFGLDRREVQKIRFLAVDINLSALRFLRSKLIEIEEELNLSFLEVVLTQSDFLEWAKVAQPEKVAFVGNPPFVKNLKGSRWKNLYADFIEAILNTKATKWACCLIVPMSVCFSRDYFKLREIINQAKCAVSISSYDNIPDSLFTSGKPESRNTNKANSQRCSIINLGGLNSALKEAAPLRRWSKNDRKSVLTTIPEFKNYSGYNFDSQFPRPNSSWILPYLGAKNAVVPASDFMDKSAPIRFSVAGVGRNYIGLREPNAANAIQIRTSSELEMLILLQVFGSKLFYEYWLTVGDGFHVTNEILERFPLSADILAACKANVDVAKRSWANRDEVRREKLNSGVVVSSFNFTEKFAYVWPKS